MTMSEFVVTRWNCKTKTHGLLSASVFFTYFCFVSQNKLMTLTLNKRQRRRRKQKQHKMKMIIYSLAQGDTNEERRPKSQSLSCLLTDLYIFIFFFFLPSPSLFTKYIYHLHCTVLVGHSEVCLKKTTTKTRKKQWKTEFNTLGVLRTSLSFRIP